MSRRFKEILAGFVYRSPEGVEEAVAGSRCAILPDGEVLASFMVQSGLGINDFRPVLASSDDVGRTWGEPRPIWPGEIGRRSIFGQISAVPGTDSVLFFGTACPIDQHGESLWNQELYGMKQNELIWARSDDRGRTWTEPMAISMPHEGSAEAPGPILVARDGSWLACYSPYRNFDPDVQVQRNCLMQLRSLDQGASWDFSKIMTFPEGESCAAEAWLVELGEGTILASCWHVNLAKDGSDLTNKLALSRDCGRSWQGPLDSGVQGQSTALLALSDSEALFLYNQRKHGEPGVRGALVEDRQGEVRIVHDELLWSAPQATQNQSSGDLAEWTDFSFGEPAMTRLLDGRYLLVFWEKSGGRAGVSYRIFEAEP